MEHYCSASEVSIKIETQNSKKSIHNTLKFLNLYETIQGLEVEDNGVNLIFDPQV